MRVFILKGYNTSVAHSEWREWKECEAWKELEEGRRGSFKASPFAFMTVAETVLPTS